MSGETSMSDCLRILGYSALWLDTGFLDEVKLREQITAFNTGVNRNAEHYRYAMFRMILSSHTVLTDRQVEQFISLALADTDQPMAKSALADLLMWPYLKTDQVDWLSQKQVFSDQTFQRIIVRRRLLAALATCASVTASTFSACIASRDEIIQRTLLSNCNLSQEQAAILAKQGANRAVRNIAQNHLNRY